MQHPHSAFRHWCTEMWFKHSDEILMWTGTLPEYNAAYYFRQHRWMLKNMFQKEQLGVDKPTIR